MVASEDSNNKILLFNNNEPPESDLCFSEKNILAKQSLLQRKDLISREKSLKKYDED